MKKRIFFIVQQLNIAGSAEYLAALMALHLSEEYDVFMYSLEKINKGKVNPNFRLNSRIRINSLNLPIPYEEKLKYIDEHKDEVKEFLSHSSFENDIFFFFTRFDLSVVPSYVKKVWVDGFEDNLDYDKFDLTIFLSKMMLKRKIEELPHLQNRFIYMSPCARFDFKEDFKFHGNHLFAITKLEDEKQCDLFINLAKELKNQDLVFHLFVACIGTYLKHFKDLIAKNKLDRVIEITSFDSIQEMLANTDLFIYMSKSKFLPMTIVEAIVNSVPVVSSSKNEYAQELIQDSGIVVEEEQIISTIINILKDKMKLSKMKFETYEYSHRFSSKDSLKSLVKLISMLEE